MASLEKYVERCDSSGKLDRFQSATSSCRQRRNNVIVQPGSGVPPMHYLRPPGNFDHLVVPRKNSSPCRRSRDPQPSLRRISSHVVPSSDRLRASAKLNDVAASSEGLRAGSKLSEAVVRKVSSVMGWRSSSVCEVIQQSRTLCSQYIRARLKRGGLLHRRMGLQRLSSLTNIVGGPELCEVFQQLSAVAAELERLHPAVYTGISRQMNVVITSERTLRQLVAAMAEQLFSEEISWAKIVSLYAVIGGLSIECVKLGHPEYLSCLIDTVSVVMERRTAVWIAGQGGWTGLITWFRHATPEPSIVSILISSGAGLLSMALIIVHLVRSLTRMVANTWEVTTISVD